MLVVAGVGWDRLWAVCDGESLIEIDDERGLEEEEDVDDDEDDEDDEDEDEEEPLLVEQLLRLW